MSQESAPGSPAWWVQISSGTFSSGDEHSVYHDTEEELSQETVVGTKKDLEAELTVS